MRVIVGARPVLICGVFAAVVAAFVGTGIGSIVAHRPPPPPKMCEERAELRDRRDSAWECENGGRVEVWLVSPYDRGLSLFKCVCPPSDTRGRGRP